MSTARPASPEERLHPKRRVTEPKEGVNRPKAQGTPIPSCDDEIAKLDKLGRVRWFEEFKDITSGIPEVLPPLREINHRIKFVDDFLKSVYPLARCPEALKPQLNEKIEWYIRAGWWIFAVVAQVTPMLCIPKWDQTIRTVVDCRKRNDNTIKDVTPFPDQEQI